MCEEDYVLDDDIPKSTTVENNSMYSIDELKKNPFVQEFMNKLSNCKTDREKQLMLEEIKQKVYQSNSPDTSTLKEKLKTKQRLLREKRTRKGYK